MLDIFTMKLLYIANSRLPTDNAHGVQIMKTCEAFADNGIDVTLLHPWRINRHAGDAFEVYRVKRNFGIITLPSFNTLMFGRIGFWFQNVTFALTVALFAMFKRYDVVYSRDEFPLLLASFIVPRCVWESHTGRYNGSIQKLLTRVARVVVITKGLKDYYVEKGIPEQKIIVAPDSVSLEDFATPQSKEESRKRLGLPLLKTIALYIGKLDSWKGAETFCAASELLPDLLCVCIGGEPADIAQLKAKYPRAEFLGWRPYSELADNQVAGDVLIIPNTARDEISVKFTSPLKLFTYMASGVPIVASDLPSIREVLDESMCSFFTPDDPKSLAASISAVVSDTETARQRAHVAQEEVQRYTWNERARHIIKSLSSL